MSNQTEQPDRLPNTGPDPLGHPTAGRAWLVAAFAAAAVYLPTMAPGLLWGDSGDAQIRVLIGQLADGAAVARSHPTYCAVGWAIHRVSGMDAARAANLLSVLGGVVTVANFAWLTACFVRRRLAVVCGVALLLLSHTLWQLATAAEVITFSTMCLSFELVCLVRFARTRRLRWLILIGLANGIGWSTHNFALLTWPAYGVVAVKCWRRIPEPRMRSLAATGAAWLLGCIPLVILVVLAYSELDSVTRMLRSVFVGRYGDQVFNCTLSVNLLGRLVAYVGLSFPTPLIVLAVPGWWRLRRTASAGTWLFLTLAGATFFLFGARYDVPDQYTFLVHSYLFGVLFVAVGVDWWLARHRSMTTRVIVVLLSITAPAAYAVAPSLARSWAGGAANFGTQDVPYRDSFTWFLTPWRQGYGGAERYARELLAELPPDAVLFINSTTRRPLEYLQHRDALRRDVRLTNPGYVRPWEHRPRITRHNIRPHIERGLVYTASDRRIYLPRWLYEGYRLTPVGRLFRVDMLEEDESGGEESRARQ